VPQRRDADRQGRGGDARRADNKVEPRPVKTGAWSGNDRVILGGLKAGDKVIIDNLIKTRPGAPVSPPRAGRRPCAPEARLQRRPRRPRVEGAPSMSRFFISRPIFASVISIVIVIAGLMASLTLPVAQYLRSPAHGDHLRHLPGANAETLSKTVAAPIEEQLSGVEGLIYYNPRAPPTAW
jgi:hypothetical protein